MGVDAVLVDDEVEMVVVCTGKLLEIENIVVLEEGVTDAELVVILAAHVIVVS